MRAPALLPALACALISALLSFLPGAGDARAQDAGLRPLCPDRPAKGTGACTVDRGHLQLETDLLDETYDRTGGVTTRTLAVASPTLKLGVTDRLDVEANLAPYLRVSSAQAPGGPRTAQSGIGDLYLRTKLNLAGNSGADFGLGVEAYLKAPTASHDLGNGAWEEGLLLPASWSLPHGWSLGLTPEADLLLDASGSGRHVALSLPVGLSHAVGPVTGTVELWTLQDLDPSGTRRETSVDLAAAWQPPRQPDLQLDAGVNLGANRATPDVQVYVGLARRF